MLGRVTMADVAQAAGVSSATVSYVISGKRPVAEHTRRVVEKAIADLGFSVNTVARSLRTGRSSIVALVVPDLSNPFFAQLAASLQEELRVLGLHVMVCDTKADREEERAFLREAVQQRFAGVVITPFRLVAKDFLVLSEAGIPAVVSADLPFGDNDLVTPDARAAIRAALTEVTEAVATHRHGQPARGTRPAAILGSICCGPWPPSSGPRCQVGWSCAVSTPGRPERWVSSASCASDPAPTPSSARTTSWRSARWTRRRNWASTSRVTWP